MTMPDNFNAPNEFLEKITDVIKNNLANEQFGVSELAEEIGMSRSNLLRKLKKYSDQSVSQFIRQIRLEHSVELLKEKKLTVSEISFKVGFSSTSYFIKCFREHYGYPPGEATNLGLDEVSSQKDGTSQRRHQLAAIMFTDIEGYTALMQQDEERAIVLRNRHREVFNETTKKFKGKVLQYFGDGTLSTFKSAIDAVRCGIELQRQFQEEPKIPLRIGIHTGDIIFSKDGIIGDGVNVAARIESLSSSGSVFISEKVYDEVKNQPTIQTSSMGMFELKNVDKPIEVFAITNEGLIVPDRKHVKGKTSSRQKTNTIKENGDFNKTKLKWWLAAAIVVILGLGAYFSGLLDYRGNTQVVPASVSGIKSIAVLPFINDSNDSSNVYIINGLMESTLNNLQKIGDLRVISRTSVEKYRTNPKTIPEIANELQVNFIVEGSGQKIGDQIMLSIQLIDAQNDQHLWSEQYNRETKDIFQLQNEVAKQIANEIQVVITPEVEERIDKIPTSDLVAYDFFLKGLEYLQSRDPELMQTAISYFNKAIERDNKFARAYAAVSMSYYRMNEYQMDKKHIDSINHYADLAMLYDDELAQSLIAKALYYQINEEYELAISYFEKALEFNPNEDLVYVFLVDLFANHFPDTEKYLQYALRGIQIDVGSYDSVTISYSYLHISNAFIQSGFEKEALKYIDLSLSYHPQNIYSHYVRAYILLIEDNDFEKVRDRLYDVLKMDTTRLDVLQEVAKINYYLRDYESAYVYYQKFIDLKNHWQLDIYPAEDIKIAIVFENMGYLEKAEEYYTKYYEYITEDHSIYRDIKYAVYYARKGETELAIESMQKFADSDENFFYWIILFPDDPAFDSLKNNAKYNRILKQLDDKFWKWHNQIRKSLEEKQLI